MSLKHTFKCDSCGKEAEAVEVDEFFHPPRDWVASYDIEQGTVLNEHICNTCRPFRPSDRKKRKVSNDV